MRVALLTQYQFCDYSHYSPLGRFGSGLAAFFLFVRHLLLLDVALTILWFAFVVIPQAVHLDYQPMSDDFYFRNLFDGQVYVGVLLIYFTCISVICIFDLDF